MITTEADWNLIIDIETDVDIEVLVDRFKYDVPQKNAIRIVILLEPTMFLVGEAMRHTGCYTHLFTYHEDILLNNPKAVLFNGMSTWVNPNMKREKKFCVSTCVGGKKGSNFPGYAQRHELWARRGEITMDKDFYLSGQSRIAGADYDNNLVLGEYKDIMFDCQYHVAIENANMRNAFSEKILDCFLSYTIPIYIGTPNIGDFFNMDGILHCNTIDEAIVVMNGLTEDDYNKKIDAVKENYTKALKYANFVAYTTSLIKDILE